MNKHKWLIPLWPRYKMSFGFILEVGFGFALDNIGLYLAIGVAPGLMVGVIIDSNIREAKD